VGCYCHETMLAITLFRFSRMNSSELRYMVASLLVAEILVLPFE